MLNCKITARKTTIFIGLIWSILSSFYLHGQSSVRENPYYYMMVTKSMSLEKGKIDFIESKKIKGQKKPVSTHYTLIFHKDVSYKSENKKINIHLFNEQDSILYIVNDEASYIIDYKKKTVTTEEQDEVIYLLRRNYPFAYFYSNLTGSGLLLMGTFKSIALSDFSTIVSFREQKIFTDIFTIQQQKNEKQANSKLSCMEYYEFRNKDTLLISHTTKIVNPNSYETGTTVEIETKILHAILDDQDYKKSDYYDYTLYCTNDFQFYDKRSLSVDAEKKTISQSTSNEKQQNMYDSPDFLKLETEMMSLYIVVQEEKFKLLAEQQEKEEINKNNSEITPIEKHLIIQSDNTLQETASVPLEIEEILVEQTAIKDTNTPVEVIVEAIPTKKVANLETTKKNVDITSPFIENIMEDVMVSIIPLEEIQPAIVMDENLTKNIIIEDVIVTLVLPETSSEEIIIQNETAYFIVLEYFKGQDNANVFFIERKEHHPNLLHLGMTPSGLYMVGIGPYKTEEEVKTLLGTGTKGWILKQQLYLH